MTTLFTSESVTEGHPDKVADSVSDAVLDALLEQNPATRAAIETLCSTGLVVVAGEVDAGESWVDVDKIARQRIVDVGYNSSEVYFDGNSCGVLVALHAQSPDIAGGVLASKEARAGSVDIKDQLGAGDQGMMFGYACRETSTLMPLPIDISHRLAEQLTAVRKSGDVDFLRPDGKTQVSVRYDGDKAVGIDTIVVSTQHDAQATQEHIAAEVRRRVIDPVLERFGWGLDDSSKILINPSGRFEIGGPHGDTGLTGRKLIVDTYGGVGRHGGGAFSGKDPSKVDRSGAYAMRWVAKNVVAAGLAERCEVQVAYAIGKAHPVSLSVTTFGTGSVPDADITRAIGEVFDLRPRSIIEDLDLIRPIYGLTSCYGHFGRELPEFTWERTDRAEALARAVRG